MNANVKIGDNCIINTNALIEHDANIASPAIYRLVLLLTVAQVWALEVLLEVEVLLSKVLKLALIVS